jgi:hypothetical protein
MSESGPDEVQPQSIPRAQFAQLNWLEGDWRGAMPDGSPFFERYRVLSDSTIRMYAFPDSTMTQPTDSSLIYWRDSHIYSEGETSRSVATRLDSAGVQFVRERGGGNQFRWEPTAEGWTATLEWTDQGGESRSVVYQMRRLN